jgi:hypothetical protein
MLYTIYLQGTIPHYSQRFLKGFSAAEKLPQPVEREENRNLVIK